MKEISPNEVFAELQKHPEIVYLDVRSVPEFQQGHPIRAINIPFLHFLPGMGMMPNDDFQKVVEANLPKETTLMVGCKTGVRSAKACEFLTSLGYKNVSNVRGGFVGVMDQMGRVLEPGWSLLDFPVCTTCTEESQYETLATKAKKILSKKVALGRDTFLVRGDVANIPFQLLKDLESVRSLFRNLKIGLYTIDVHGNFLEATDDFLEILGLASMKELRQNNARERLNLEPYDRNPATPRQDRLVRELDLMIRRTDGRLMTLLDISYAARDEKTGDLVYHGIIVDVTDRKRSERSALEQPSLRDPLTGSYNRLYLEDFERRMNESGKNWGCIYIFIDHFKQFNDRYGYETGEEVLRKMSRFLMRYARATDGVIRMGDDEFVVLLPNVEPSVVARINRRFRQAALGQAPITFSMGTGNRFDREALEQTILRASRELNQVRVLHSTPKTVRR